MRVAVLLTLTVLCTASGAKAQEKEVIQAPGAPPGLPFSSAVRSEPG